MPSKPGTRSGTSTSDPTPTESRRQSDLELVNQLNSVDNLSQANLGGDPQFAILQMLRHISNTQSDSIKSITENRVEIVKLQTENKALKSELNCAKEEITRIDQYSRKGVMTITGLAFQPSETQQSLESGVLNFLNGILRGMNSQASPITLNDFVALHRNGRASKPGPNNSMRPPTITAKFIRYHVKDLFFSKDAVAARKRLFNGIGIHHNICPTLIQEQKLIAEHSATKFVNFMGTNRWFSVCLNNGTFINFVRNFNHFVEELAKVNP